MDRLCGCIVRVRPSVQGLMSCFKCKRSDGYESINLRTNLIRYSFIHQWLYSPLLGPGLFFSYVIFFYTVGRTPWTSDQPVARPLPTRRTTQTQNKRTHRHPCLWVGFEPTIPAIERATARPIDRQLDIQLWKTISWCYGTHHHNNVL
jgi:hypothetical protein